MALSDLLSDEREIVAAILDAASAAGFLASVFDGEAYAVGLSADYARVREHVGDTDETTLRFRDPSVTSADGRPVLVGWVYLVHGNGADVIADYSDNAETAALLAPALAVSDRLAVVS